MRSGELLEKITSGTWDPVFARLYGADAVEQQHARYSDAVRQFEAVFGAGRSLRLFSAPGRTEVGGNHTDHQRGCVLAASVNLDALAIVSPNTDGVIRIQSAGYPRDEIRTDALDPVESERNHAASLIRGVTARFLEEGYRIGGFDAYTTSDVLGGSGLSSSAAFEVLVGTILSCLFNEGRIAPIEIAQMGQYAENNYFGKPSGLMDQAASAVGGFITIDFERTKHPRVEQVDFDFTASGYRLCIVDTKGDHADLTEEYAAVPQEMRQVAALFGCSVLREVDPDAFYSGLDKIHGKVSDRALARALHFFEENARVGAEVAALREGDFEAFCSLVVESGRSSAMYLQNVFACSDTGHQGLTLALALSERILKGRGAWRVHGGGFAGTIQAFVPEDLLEEYRAAVEMLFGAGSCHVLGIRPVGLCEITGNER